MWKVASLNIEDVGIWSTEENCTASLLFGRRETVCTAFDAYSYQSLRASILWLDRLTYNSELLY